MYQLNISQDPAYLSHVTSVKSSETTALVALLATTGVLLLLYLLLFVITLVRNIYFIFTSVTPRSRGLFLLSLAMMITCLATLVFGVYSPFYTNGHLSVFFIALCNIYVWALIYLNWPAGFETDFSTAAGGASEAVANTGVDKSAQKPNEEGLHIQFERGAKKSTAAGMRIENSTTHNEEDVFASQNQVEETKEGHHQ